MTYSSANIYSSIVWLYPALAVTQIFILGVVVPVRTASAISGEKERQTFDIMMTTSMTGFSIIMGKVLTAMIQSMFYVVAGLPIVALAFVIGGLFCLIGQILIDKTTLTPARILVGYVVAGVLLGALGWYQPLIDFAGAGATVPLTGFGSLLARGVKEAVAEQGLLGALVGGLQKGAAGIAAAILFSVLAALIFRSKDQC